MILTNGTLLAFSTQSLYQPVITIPKGTLLIYGTSPNVYLLPKIHCCCMISASGTLLINGSTNGTFILSILILMDVDFDEC